MARTLNIVIGGEAGQGLVTVGDLLSKSLVRSGYNIVVNQSYLSRVRGGHNTFEILVSDSEINSPVESIDILVALNRETIDIHKENISENGICVADSDFGAHNKKCICVPYKDLAKGGRTNIVALGVLSAILGLKKDLVNQLIADTFGKKHPESTAENEMALQSAYYWTVDKKVYIERLPHIKGLPQRMMMNGNQAIALGAISAGLKFYSFYPMTPSTSISLTITGLAGKMGIACEQAEDEIAAINMAVGASYAGAPSMVATSGGGFALMVEGVSLSAMTETPIVIALAQRPAPATGLPTRTEQADLDLALYSGHGEFPRAIFAPGTVEECFWLTRQAFFLAEKYQTPTFVLTDQYLSDCLRAVGKIDIESLKPVTVGVKSDDANYLRYKLTADGISPRAIPGKGRALVVADSDEHTEDGHLTEDLSVRVQMNDKRLKKGEGLRAECIAPEFIGIKSPEILIVSWGSTRGAALDAVLELKGRGIKASLMNFSQVWPINGDHFLDNLKKAKRVVMVEGNATSQFGRLVFLETGFEIKEAILRYDGLPITAKYILEKLLK